MSEINPIPSSPEEVTPDALTLVLRKAGDLREAQVTDIDTRVVGQGAGFMGQLVQFRPRYDKPEATAPPSVVAKFPATTPENREVAELFRFYEREMRFYQDLAPRIPVKTPKHYYSALDPKDGRYVLLLEDLSVRATCGDQVAGCSAETAELALRELAKFHAQWWDTDELEALEWMPYTSDPVIAEAARQSYERAWGPFLENFGQALPPEMKEIGERFGKQIIRLITMLGERPRTIMHGDYRLDNLFFSQGPNGEELVVIDWQISSRGRGAFDLAYFLSGTLHPEERKARERELVATYHRILEEHGVTGYSFEECWEDYRASALFCFLYSVIAIGTLDLANERGLALFMNNLQRNVAAIRDLNAHEFLD